MQMRIMELIPLVPGTQFRTLPDDAAIGASRPYNVKYMMLLALAGGFGAAAAASILTTFRQWHWALGWADVVLVLSAALFLARAVAGMLLAERTTYQEYARQGWPTPELGEETKLHRDLRWLAELRLVAIAGHRFPSGRDRGAVAGGE